MAGKRDAEITIGADASAVERAQAVMKVGWQEAATAVKNAFGEATRSMVSSLADVALAQGKVNFASQHEGVRQFEASSARLAVSMGRDLESVRVNLETTGKAVNKRPQEVAAWASEVGKLTYNFSDAADGLKGIAELSAMTGRSTDDYRGLAVELGTVGKVGGDTSHAIAMITGQAEALKTHGGVAAFADQVVALGDVISHFAVNAPEDFNRVINAAGILTKDLDPAAAKRVGAGAFGSIASDPMGWSRYLGRDITNKQGQVDKPEEVLQQITEKIQHTYGKDSRRMLMLQFGAETGAALANRDWKAAAASAEGAPPSEKPKAALERLDATDFGKREKAEVDLANSAIDLMKSSSALGTAADALQRFASHSPILSTLGATIAGNAMGNFMSEGGKALATIMGGKGEGGAAGGALRLMGGTGGALAKIGATGAALGSVAYAYSEIAGAAKEIYGSGENGFMDDLGHWVGGKDAAAKGNKDYAAQKAQNDRNVALAHARALAKTGGVPIPLGPDGAPLPVGGGVAGSVGGVPAKVDLDYAKMAAAMKDALKDNLKVDVHPAVETPVHAVVRKSHSHAAGSQR